MTSRHTLGSPAIPEARRDSRRILLVAYDHQKPTAGPDTAAVEPRPARELVRLDVIRMLDSLHNRVAALAQLGMIEGDLLASDPLEEHDHAATRINNTLATTRSPAATTSACPTRRTHDQPTGHQQATGVSRPYVSSKRICSPSCSAAPNSLAIVNQEKMPVSRGFRRSAATHRTCDHPALF
jgi:hypothetical protein